MKVETTLPLEKEARILLYLTQRFPALTPPLQLIMLMKTITTLTFSYLPALVTIISVPSSLNLLQRVLISSVARTATNFG